MKETMDIEKEATQIWDERDLKWKLAYEARFRRLETVKFIKAVLFDSTGEVFTSEPFECAPHKEFLLLIDLDVTSTPTNIQIWVEFSHDFVNWFKLMNGPFGSLMYVSAQGDLKECVTGKIIAHWMRIYIVSSGCEATKTFKLSVTAEVSA